jgi:hypothetical protein
MRHSETKKRKNGKSQRSSSNMEKAKTKPQEPLPPTRVEQQQETEEAEHRQKTTFLERLDQQFSAVVNISTSVADTEDFPLGW